MWCTVRSCIKLLSVLGSTYACSRVIHHCPTKTTSYAFRVCKAPTNREQMPYCCKQATIGLWQKRVSYTVSNSMLRLFLKEHPRKADKVQGCNLIPQTTQLLLLPSKFA